MITTKHRNSPEFPSEYTQKTSNQSNIRHGDLKPENILRFAGPDFQEELRILKIADMGLAKQHAVATEYRDGLIATRWGTVRYEAPEAQTASGNQPRSPLYDIWSMGCINFEFVIWLLYGNDQVETFYERLQSQSRRPCSYFTLSETDGGRQKVELSPLVRHWINHIRTKDPEYAQESAISDLVDLIDEKLPVVPIKTRRPTRRRPAGGWVAGQSGQTADSGDKDNVRYRATVRIFRDSLDEILGKVESGRDYLLTASSQERIPPPEMQERPKTRRAGHDLVCDLGSIFRCHAIVMTSFPMDF